MAQTEAKEELEVLGSKEYINNKEIKGQ